MAVFEKRHHLRGDWDPVWLLIGETFHRTEIWSRGGALLEEYQGPLTPGALFSVSALGRDGGDAVAVEIKGRVVRHEPENRLAVQFLVIDRRAHDFFADVLGEPVAEPPRSIAGSRFPPPPRARMARSATPT